MLHGAHIPKCITAALLAILVLASGCSEDEPDRGGAVDPRATFQFKLHGDADAAQDFIAITSDPAVIAAARAQLRRPADQRLLHISGRIMAAGPDWYLQWRWLELDWSWRFADDQWELAEASIGVCDGTPQMVEQDVQAWLRLGRFCPWGSYVAAELTDREVAGIIVKFSDDLDSGTLNARLQAVQDVALTREIGLEYSREAGLGAHVWEFTHLVTPRDARDLTQVISLLVPDVEYAEPNTIMDIAAD